MRSLTALLWIADRPTMPDLAEDCARKISTKKTALRLLSARGDCLKSAEINAVGQQPFNASPKDRQRVKKIRNLWKRGNKWWSNVTIHGKVVRKPLHKDEKIAYKKLLEMIQTREADPEDTSWDVFKFRYLEFLSARPESTRMSHKRAIKLLEDFRPIRDVREVTPGLLEQIKVRWDKIGRGPSIKVKDIKSLRSMMRRAELWYQTLRRQDWKSVKVEREVRANKPPFTKAEIDLMLANFKGWRLTAVWLGWRAGLRRGEMKFLHRDDVDFRHNGIRIVSKPKLGHIVKSYEERFVPMKADLRAYLKNLLSDGREWVLGEGHEKSLVTLSVLFREAVRLLKIKGYLHKLRHTFSNDLRNRHTEWDVIRDLLGHSSVVTTEGYVQSASKAMIEAVNSL